ncbi:hypothetical protein [Mesorhizobium huakuii]|uniref:Uncharacterized protein n=1 Tax=Mesorhizobium huakuii TaxID=28104 RepID=A0A7G6SQW1_9HYPH|nr:hypothetical protein [Mesorhizobium huakuii]QND56893.1 hypothetical protein HB778_09925 [Mesorhizobium huakuii]
MLGFIHQLDEAGSSMIPRWTSPIPSNERRVVAGEVVPPDSGLEKMGQKQAKN